MKALQLLSFVLLFLSSTFFISCFDVTDSTGNGSGEGNAIHITGRVLDNENFPISGVVAKLAKTGLADTTDFNGRYVIYKESIGQSTAKIGAEDILDTLVFIRCGRKITTMDITNWIDSLPDLKLVQRDISGFLEIGGEEIGKIEAVLSGDGIPADQPVTIEFFYNKAAKQYSGYIYFPSTGEIQNYTVYVIVYNTNDKLTGLSEPVSFNSRAGDIVIPSFSSENAKPAVDAGNDTTVTVNDTIILHGSATDASGGSIVKWEWDIGNTGNFIQTSTGDTTISAPSTTQLFECVLRVTDDDENTGKDTVVIEVKLPPPSAVPPGRNFSFEQFVTLTHDITGTTIYYRLNDGNFMIYNDENIHITKTTVLEAYATMGDLTGDTLLETYTKTDLPSQLSLKKPDGSPITFLTEIDHTFIIEITTPYAGLNSAAAEVSTVYGGDSEVFTIYNPQVLPGQAMVFTDTVTFSVGMVTGSDNILQSSASDTIRVSWTNPLNASDAVSSSIVVRPVQEQPFIYFTNAAGNPLSEITGKEDSISIVVEGQLFDPSRNDYTVSVKNILGPGNIGPADAETFPLVAMGIPGRYQARFPVSRAVATANDGTLQARIGDQIQATYTDPVDGDQANAQIGFGLPTEQPAVLAFTNADYTIPLELGPEGFWDANKDSVYLVYKDDSIDVSTPKSITLGVSNFPGKGGVIIDMETFSMANRTIASGGVGTWVLALPIVENPAMVPNNGALEFYFKGEIVADVQSHKNANTEQLDGGTARSRLTVAYPSMEDTVIITDPLDSAGIVTRYSETVQVCVKGEVFTRNTTQADTVFLRDVQCTESRDLIPNLPLVQITHNSNTYCGMFAKSEINRGDVPFPDISVLACYEGDTLVVNYVDPVYLTEVSTSVYLDSN